jgi:elongation factor Ts
MAQIDMKQVKELRDRTQAGLNDCRSALMEAEGDMEKAVEVILKKGLAKSAKRAGMVAAEGVVAARVSQDQLSAIIVEVNIQTDFAARNEEFGAFVEKVVQAAEAAKDGADLSAEPFPGGQGTIEDNRAALVGKLGENITVRRWQRVRVASPGKVTSYIHMGGKIGVILGVKTQSAEVAQHAEVAKFLEETAMQVAAMNPPYLRASDIPDADKKQQSEIFAGQLAEEGKIPQEKWPGVIEGKLSKWAKEVCLLDQPSVLEPKKTVDEIRKDVEKAAGGTVEVVGFVRFERGEGIAQPQGADFAAEVAAMASGNN